MVPPWLVMVFVLAIAMFIVFILAIYFSIPSKRNFNLHKKHAIVTGESDEASYLIVFLIKGFYFYNSQFYRNNNFTYYLRNS
uniref:Wsv460 n=1 Tax=Heterorhabditis bacteriophora TaxID=37862 RepID=A0A1I7WNY4_HETBA